MIQTFDKGYKSKEEKSTHRLYIFWNRWEYIVPRVHFLEQVGVHCSTSTFSGTGGSTLFHEYIFWNRWEYIVPRVHFLEQVGVHCSTSTFSGTGGSTLFHEHITYRHQQSNCQLYYLQTPTVKLSVIQVTSLYLSYKIRVVMSHKYTQKSGHVPHVYTKEWSCPTCIHKRVVMSHMYTQKSDHVPHVYTVMSCPVQATVLIFKSLHV